MTSRVLVILLGCVAAVDISGAEKGPKPPLEGARVFAGPPGENAPASVQTKRSAHDDPTTFARAVGILSADVGRGNQLTLWEGVPRSGDKAAIEEQRRQRQTLTVDGQVFFADAQTVPPELAEKLREMIFAAARVSRGGVKLCGGFHADFLLKWESAVGDTEALLCFGCSELKMYGGSASLYGDIDKAYYNGLRDLLTPFAKARPKSAGVK
jgi:hypothetical protein